MTDSPSLRAEKVMELARSTEGVFSCALAHYMLLNATAHLLAANGPSSFIKSGPIKDAACSLSYAFDRVTQSLIRERAASYAGKAVTEIEEEIKTAALESIPAPVVAAAETNNNAAMYERTNVGD